jgi:protein NRD1
MAPTSNGLHAQATPNGQTNPPNVAPANNVAAPPDAGALLAALAGFGQQNAPANPMPVAPPAMSFAQNMAPVPPPGFFPPPPPTALNGQPPAFPAVPNGINIAQLAAPILQAVQAGQLQPDQAFQLINALNAQQNGGVAFPPQPSMVSQAPPVQQNIAQQDRFEPNGNRVRDRSRSPDMHHRRHSPARRSPPNRRDSPTYGVYDPNANADGNRGDRGRGRGRGRGGRNDRNEYRQRTPPPQRRQHSPVGNGFQNGGAKFLDWDQSLPRDHIKVLSRTLFIGGATGTEGEIRSIFSRFGKVQTCIVNQDKRHAFVKMLTRPDAVAAKEGMDAVQDPTAVSKARQVSRRLACAVRSS